MKKTFLLTALAAAFVGSALHFLYDLWPGALTALISPINESVWEHFKLLFWPTLAAAFFLATKTEKPIALWGAVFLVLPLMPVFLGGLYYLLGGGFQIMGLALDIGLYFLTMILGFLLIYALRNNRHLERAAGYLLILTILYGAALILLTFAAPPLAIFTPPAQDLASASVFSHKFLFFMKKMKISVDFFAYSAL